MKTNNYIDSIYHRKNIFCGKSLLYSSKGDISLFVVFCMQMQLYDREVV